MGFKRTAEGRVFFENPSEGEENKDLQIVGLLRALNERLKTAQGERAKLLKDMEHYRDTIEDLNERAARSEQAYIDLEQKVSSRQNESVKKAGRTEQATKETLQELLDTREMITALQEKTMLSEKSFSDLKDELSERKKTEDILRRHQLALEKMHKDQNEKIVGSVAAYVALTRRVNESETKFDTLDNKIEETASEQMRLERKIEKSDQDRSRMLRKVDRIEETVIQTRDALNAKAMVVLADQGVEGLSAAQKMVEQDPAPALLENRADAASSWWSKSWPLQATGMATVLLAGLLGGLFLSEMKMPQWPLFEKEQVSFFEDKNPVPPDDRMAVQNTEQWQPVFAQEDAAPAEEDIEPALAIETEVEPVINQMDISDDIGTLDLNNEEQLLAALESDPDALAARLNAIEPSSVGGEEAVQMATAPAAIDTNVIHAPQETKAETVVEEGEEEEPTLVLKPRPGLRNRIKPDPALTKVVKEIEAQAFAGVPEAQHDLAAIYTAGHGGTKQNYKRAGLWFREAAESGIANARYNLGVLYHQGLGVKQDTGKAIKWYKTAAELGHPEAQYNLGIAYIEGIGVPYDPHKAAGYFESATTGGVMEASYNLGLIYENALLGKAEPDQALKWYKKAADAGSPEAKAALEQLAKTLNIKLSDVNKLVENIGSAKTVVEKTSVKKVPAIVKPVAASPEPDIEPTSQTLQPDSGRILTAQIQKHLMQLGLYPGPADGLRGPLTLDAIRSYQLFNDLEDTGKVSEALLSHMRSDPQVNEVGSREE